MESHEPSGPLRILVVEDLDDARDSLVLLLSLWGHDTFATSDGAEALRLAAEHLPKVILLDLAMPGLSGLEVARRVRALPALKGVCLIATTGYGDPESQADARAAGFDHVLVKPFDPHELERLLCACTSDTNHAD